MARSIFDESWTLVCLGKITKLNENIASLLNMPRTYDKTDKQHVRRREREPHLARKEPAGGTFSVEDQMRGDDTNFGAFASCDTEDMPESLPRKIFGQSCFDGFIAYRIFWLFICLTVLLIAASGCVLAHEFNEKLSGDRNDGNTGSKYDLLHTAILDWGFTSREALDDPDSPQGRALRWLSDGGKETENLEVARTRFSLATIYFSTNFVQQDSGASSAWNQQSNWMSSDTVCVWHGVICVEEESALGRVQALNLSSNGLAGVLPQEIGLLMHGIRSLDLGNNAIEGTIPDALSNLRNLGTYSLYAGATLS